MTQDKPYAYYKFVGIKAFTKLLEDSGITFVLFDDEAVRHLFKAKPDYFNAAEDSISIGKCTQEGTEVYFAEFGIKITKSYRSYIVFIFDHHPTIPEMLVAADDIEPLIQQSLDGVNLEEIQGLQ